MLKGDPTAAFAALGERSRLAIVTRLAGGAALSIAALAADATITRQAITKHLQVLEAAGLIAHSRMGREMRYALHPAGFDAMQAFLTTVTAQWDDALGRLKAFVER